MKKKMAGFGAISKGAVCVLAGALGLLPVAVSASEADSYPSKPVRLLVPFAAGGGTDLTARRLAQALQPIVGQPVIVENRPGAGGNIGAQAAARAAPDGHTIFFGAIGPNVVNQYLYPNQGFDPVNDFIPVTNYATFDYIVVVAATSPIKTFRDLIDTAKKNPGKLNYGIVAIAAPTHLGVEKLKRDGGLEMIGIPYKGSPPAIVDLLGGRIDFMFDAIGPQMANITAGRVRVLANTANARSVDFPDIRPIADAGFKDYSLMGWTGLFVPANTPQPIVNKIFESIKKAQSSPELSKAARQPGENLVISASPKAFADFVAAERITWAKVIREANIKLD